DVWHRRPPSSPDLQPGPRGLATSSLAPRPRWGWGSRQPETDTPLRYLPHPMKVREVIRMLEQNGWHQVAQRGSHHQFRHPTKPGRVTVAGNPGQDLAPGTLGILRQAGLSKEAR